MVEKTKKTIKKSTAAIKEPLTKSQIYTAIAEETGLEKKQVVSVFDSLSSLIERSIKPKSIGSFTLLGLLKISAIKKPARKARKARNPFTGEEITVKAKPAYWSIKARALKKLKDMAEG